MSQCAFNFIKKLAFKEFQTNVHYQQRDSFIVLPNGTCPNVHSFLSKSLLLKNFKLMFTTSRGTALLCFQMERVLMCVHFYQKASFQEFQTDVHYQQRDSIIVLTNGSSPNVRSFLSKSLLLKNFKLMFTASRGTALLCLQMDRLPMCVHFYQKACFKGISN